jgi:hypothetical protein
VQFLNILPKVSEEIRKEVDLGIGKLKFGKKLFDPIDMILRLSALLS